MAKLLTVGDDREIRDAVQLLADTFFDTPVEYYKFIPSLDAYNEDKPEQQFKLYTLKALAEYSTLEQNKDDASGQRNMNEIKLTFNLEDLERQVSLINADFTHNLVTETDYFKCKGRIYKTENIYYDGPLSRKDVLILVEGRITEKSNFKLV